MLIITLFFIFMYKNEYAVTTPAAGLEIILDIMPLDLHIRGVVARAEGHKIKNRGPTDLGWHRQKWMRTTPLLQP